MAGVWSCAILGTAPCLNHLHEHNSGSTGFTRLALMSKEAQPSSLCGPCGCGASKEGCSGLRAPSRNHLRGHELTRTGLA
eukprot:132643-Pelagomonas_calceolata.AAC.3